MDKIEVLFEINNNPTKLLVDKKTLCMLEDDDYTYIYLMKKVRAGEIVGVDQNIAEDEIIISRIEHLNSNSQDSKQSKVEEFDEELFISLVSQRPALYNFKMPLVERTKLIKEKLWQEIIEIMATKLDSTGLNKKWKALKDYYYKVKTQVDKKIPSGSGATVAKKNIWKHYTLLKFLDDSLESRDTICSVAHIPDTPASEIESTSSETASTSSEIQGPTPAKRKKLSDAIFLEHINKIVNEPIKVVTEKKDEVYYFCMRLAEGMKRLPHKARAELEIEFLTKLHTKIIEHC